MEAHSLQPVKKGKRCSSGLIGKSFPPILNIAPNDDRVDATGQLGEKSAKIGPFHLCLDTVYINLE
jgi:hypothetical protein